MTRINKIFTEKISKFIEENSDYVLDDIEDEVEKFKSKLDSSIVKDIFILFEKYSSFHFGIPGSLTHFIERLEDTYKKELVSSLKRFPTVHTLALLQRVVNGTNVVEQREIYINIYDEIFREESLTEELKEIALEHICLNEEKEKLRLMNKIIKLHENKEDYSEVLKDALTCLSENTGDAEGFVVTEDILERWYNLGIIDKNRWIKCIEKSAVNRWL